MKNKILGSLIAVAWCVATPVAQQQPPSTPSSPAHNVFVATGCLSAGDDRAPAFKLTDASPIGRTATPRAAEAGAVGTSGLTTSYELQPASGVNAQGLKAEALKAHAGQRVEATLRPIESMAAPAPAGAANVGSQAVRPADAPAQRFSVTAIKPATGDCPD